MHTSPTRRRRVLRRLTATALIAVTGFAATACTTGESGPPRNDHPRVVASTDVWGSVATAVGGQHAEITALFNTPGADPHEFEPSMADTAEIQDADVLVYNGGHYDAYVETAAAESNAITVNATAIALGDAAAAEHAGHDHAGHDHSSDDHDHASGANEHVFYDLAAVAQVADQVAAALSEVAPAHADYFAANAAEFTTGIADLRSRLAAIKKAHDGTTVGSTEPLSEYLLAEAGLVDIAPAAFAAAVENGQSPSAADVAKFTDLIEHHQIKALLYNTQAVDPATLTVLQLARRSSVPVVELTESLPAGVTSYLQWQSGQIGQLEKALN